MPDDAVLVTIAVFDNSFIDARTQDIYSLASWPRHSYDDPPLPESSYA